MHPLYRPYGVYGHTATQWFELTDTAKKVRRYLEDTYIQNGRGPNLAQICRDLTLDQNQAWHALHQLEQGVQVMFVPGTENIIKMPPFSDAPTRHRVTVDGVSKWYTGCAGEASAVNAMFPGKTVVVDSYCPDCWGAIRVESRDRKTLSVDPPEAVIHIGIHPERFRDDWNVTCDSINFFLSKDHVAAWEAAFPEKRGMVMPVAMGNEWVDGIAVSRYWNYDRGPDTGNPAGMIARFREMGLDVGVWEQAPAQADGSREGERHGLPV